MKGFKLKLVADVAVFPLPLSMQVIQKVYVNASCLLGIGKGRCFFEFQFRSTFSGITYQDGKKPINILFLEGVHRGKNDAEPKCS